MLSPGAKRRIDGVKQYVKDQTVVDQGIKTSLFMAGGAAVLGVASVLTAGLALPLAAGVAAAGGNIVPHAIGEVVFFKKAKKILTAVENMIETMRE